MYWDKIDEYSKYYVLLRHFPYITSKVIKEFKLDIFGDHGIVHWNNVYLNALELAKYYDIYTEDDKYFFALFALFHDSKRENEYQDIEHGLRGSNFLNSSIGETFENLEFLDKLCFACSNHTSPNFSHPYSDDILVKICWDADRLDIGRVGIDPDKKYLFTDYAKEILDKRKI